MSACPRCDAELPEDFRFCDACGVALSREQPIDLPASQKQAAKPANHPCAERFVPFASRAAFHSAEG